MSIEILSIFSIENTNYTNLSQMLIYPLNLSLQYFSFLAYTKLTMETEMILLSMYITSLHEIITLSIINNNFNSKNYYYLSLLK